MFSDTYFSAQGLNPLDPIERHVLSHAARGNWSEVVHTLKTLTDLSKKQMANLLRQCASKRKGELVKKFKNQGVGTGARSGQHGTPFSRAGAQLQREANQIGGRTDPLANALRQEAERALAKARGFNH